MITGINPKVIAQTQPPLSCGHLPQLGGEKILFNQLDIPKHNDIDPSLAWGRNSHRTKLNRSRISYSDCQNNVLIGYEFYTHRLEADAPQNEHNFYNNSNTLTVYTIS